GVTLALGAAPGGQPAVRLVGTAPSFANVIFTGHAQAITVTGGISVDFDSCRFSSNTTALTATGGALVLDDCIFDLNTDGIVATGNCSVSIEGGAFSGNTGTALRLGAQANTLVQPIATLNDVTFSANRTGISAYGGAVTLTACDFDHHTDTAIAVLDACRLTITGGTFADNSSAGDGAALRMGGTNPYPRYPVATITGATFARNQAANGGAIDAFAKNNTLTIADSTFTGNFTTSAANSANTGGGVLHVRDGSVVVITGSTFTGNSGKFGGVINAYLTKSVTVTGSHFEANSASGNGGVIYSDSVPAFSITDTTFKANTADTSGAISCFGGSNYAGLLTITRCSFTGHNSRAGAALNVGFSSAAIRDSLFANNQSDGNSVISNNDAQLTLDHVTVANNVSTTTGSIASAIRGTGTRGGTTIRNSILWNNTSALPFESYFPTVEKRQLTASNGLSLSNTIIQGLSTYLGNGLGSANPHFVDSANGDYRLAAWSNAIDRGSVSFVLPGETDLAGAARTQAAAPDLGAYESSATAALLPSFAQPATLSVPLDGTFTLTQPVTPGYTATWQYFTGVWSDFATTTSSTLARSVTVSADRNTVTFTGLKAAFNNVNIRVSLTNGHDTYASGNIVVTIKPFAVLHVDGSLVSSGDGASWSTAFKTLPEALAAIDGDRRIIWIAAGNYPTATAYQIPQGVELYGGFPAGGATFAARSPAANLVVLSGGDTEVVRFTAGNSTLAQAVLDGVSVTSGQTGILADGFSPTLRNLVVGGHSATGLVLRNSNAFVGASTFENNTGVNGGGLSIIGGTPRLDRLTVRGNTAALGGGIYTNTGLYLTSSLVTGNLATTGGGFYIAGYPLVEQTTIAANRATASGSAIHVDGGSRITLRNDIVWGNGAAPLTTDNPVFTAAYTLSYVTREDAPTVTNQVFKHNPYFPSPSAPSAAPTTAGVYTVPAFSLVRQAGQFLAANNGALDLAGQPRVAFGTADLGAYEGTDGVATPYLITTSPAPVAFRRDGVGNVFTASATNATGYEWQVFTGGEWVTLLGNTAFSGADGSTLTVLSADYAMNGTRIRVIVNGPGGPLVSSEAMLTVYPNRYYVRSGATAGANGDAWATAFPSLQSALAVIPYDTSGTEIWISGGDYLATGTLNLRPGQLVYGGFAGTESTLAERDLSANVTRLIAAANSARTLNLLSTGTTGFAFRLDGITLDTTTAQTGCAITNESTRDLVLEQVRILRHERALYQAAAANSTDTVGSLTVRRSEIRGNGKASVDASFILRGGSAFIENTLFAGNRANFISAAEITAPAILRNVTFAGNQGWTALALNDASNETRNCVFWGNRNGASVTSLQPYYREFGTQNVIEGYDATFFTDAIGNIAADPAFVAPVSASAAPTTTGDYRLRAPSAAIDLGDDAEAASGSVDLAGSDRLASLHIDAGAYEYQGVDLYRIATQPADASAVSAPAVFTVAVAPVTATYAWEESSDNGATYTPVSGATSASLIVPGTLAAHGHLFRVQVRFDAGPLVASDAAELTTVKATVTADIPAGYGTPRDYSASANFIPASWQWEMSTDGASFTDVADETSDVLSILGDSSFANRSYRVRATYATGAVVYSNSLAFAYADVSVAPSSATSGTASNLAFGIAGGGVSPSTLTDASLFVHASLTGRLLLADFAAPIFSGDNVTLAFAPAAHAGERIQVTTTSALGRTDGLGLRPRVWEFHAPVTSGTGAFSPPVPIGAASATAFALGDLNADGSVDALIATATGLQLCVNNGAAAFTTSGAAFGPGSASALALGSLNASGALDAAVLTNSGDIQLWSNDGAGVFTLGQTLAGLGAQALTLGDLDADGDLDLVLATSTGTRVCLNDGSGSYAVAASFGTDSVHALARGDLDQDGDLDLVTLGDTGTTVWSNNGAAGYAAATAVSDLFDRVALADLDADGRLDVVLVRSGDPATLWRNLGNAAFTTLAATPGGGGVTTLATGDTDGDGRADLVLTDSLGRTGAWLTSPALASTRFADQPFFTLGAAAELADLDGDGALDLFALDRLGAPSVANYRVIGSAGNEDTTFGLVSGGFRPTPYISFVYIVELPAHGTLLVNGQPLGGAPNQYHYYAAFDLSNLHTITYRPNSNFSGLDSFGWRDSMSNPTHAYQLSVRNVDDDVVALPETITALEGDTLTVLDGGATSVLANDTNRDPVALVATVLTGPAHGALTLLANGTFRYIHDGSATTSDSFTYLATNPATGRSSGATVSIGITRHNVAPSALVLTATAGTHYTGQPSGESVATLSATDPDALDAGLLVYTLVPGDGSAHNADFVINGASLQTAAVIQADSGVYRTVRIRVTDTLGSFSEQAFTVGFTQAPTALPATLSTDEDNAVAIVLPAAGGASALAYELTSAPSHGTLTLSTTAPGLNSYDYTPNANSQGTDTFTFRVADSALTSANATVTITVNAVEDLPTLATVAPITINEDTSTSFTLVGADGDGTALTYQLNGAVSFGTVQINDASVTYTPDANASGTETLAFTVTDGANTSAPVAVVITVTAINDAPVIAAVGARTVQRNRTDTFTAAITDVEGSATTLAVGTAPQHGSVDISTHSVTYTPDTGYTGADSYTLIANDGTVGSTPITVAVTIAPIGTENVALIVYRGLYEYTAVPSYTGTWTGAVIGNIGTPTHGTATIEGSQLVYDHNGDTATSDNFTYTVTNAADDIRTIAVSVTIKDRILDVTDGSFFSATGNLRAAIDLTNRFAADTIAPAHTAGADWTIRILPQAGATSTLLHSTYDLQSGVSFFRIHGNVTIDASASPGHVLTGYFPDSARHFMVMPGASLTLKHLTLLDGDSPYYVSFGGSVLNFGTFIAEDVVFRGNSANLGAAIFNNGGTASLTDCVFDQNIVDANDSTGGIVVSRNGYISLTRVTFTANTGKAGGDLYVMGDGALATVDVSESNIPSFQFVTQNGGTLAIAGLPKAINDAFVHTLAQTLSINTSALLANDLGTPAASVTVATTSAKGVTITRTGDTLAYLAPVGVTGGDSFTYTITDAVGRTSTATVSLSFVNAAALPRGNADTGSIYRGLSGTIDVLANDTDDTGDTLTLTAVTTPAHGRADIESGVVRYTHNGDAPATDAFTYSVTNSTGTTTNVVVNVTIAERFLDATSGADSGPGTLRAALAYIDSFGNAKLAPVEPEDPTDADGSRTPDWTIRIVGASGQRWETTTSSPDEFVSIRSAFRIAGKVTIDATLSPGFELQSLLDSQSPAPVRNFFVQSSASLTLKNLRLIGSGNMFFDYVLFGGAVLNEGTFIADQVTFEGYRADRGVAVYNEGGTATLLDCSFANNETVTFHGHFDGGAIFSTGGSLTLVGNTFADEYINPEVNAQGSTAVFFSGNLNFTRVLGESVTTPDMPVAVNDTIERPYGKTFKVSIAALLANDTHAAGATVTFAPTSQEGYTLTRSGAFLLYQAPASFGGGDTFTYTVTRTVAKVIAGVTRNFAVSSTATVTLNVTAPPESATIAPTLSIE
ncbi:MAG: tandem-95 repeat protein, partial [Burkholderiales bacterium]|nr:tandem-95 repeat protein [Opitutaceae bacterium]